MAVVDGGVIGAHLICMLLLVGMLVFMVLYVMKLNDHTASDISSAASGNSKTMPNADFIKTTLSGVQKESRLQMEGFSIDNPFEQFDQIYYINLDKRPDRRLQIETELRRMGVPFDRVKRIPGVIEKFGALGCSKAHLNALLDCKSRGFRNCLILEDDFVFKFNRETTWEYVNRMWKMRVQWDVLMFSANLLDYETTQIDILLKVKDAQTTSGYAVNGPFLDQLIANYQSGVGELEKTTSQKERHPFCIDIYWKKLQPQNRWYIFQPALGNQRDSYSDIEGHVVSYDDKKDLAVDVKKYEFMVCVKTCVPRLGKNTKQLEVLKALSLKHPIAYYQYYGVPSQQEDFLIDEEQRVISLKCKDDYLNLCHKVGQLMHSLRNLQHINRSWSSLKGVFFTDDDIELIPDRFYETLNQNLEHPYWGHVAVTEGNFTRHLEKKAEQSDAIGKQVAKYPDLLLYPIETYSATYCPGGGFFLSMSTLLAISGMDDLFSPFPETAEDLNFYKIVSESKTFFSKSVCVIDDLNVGVATARLGILPFDVDIFKIANWPH